VKRPKKEQLKEIISNFLTRKLSFAREYEQEPSIAFEALNVRLLKLAQILRISYKFLLQQKPQTQI
jgi:hypothetical protein